MQKVNVMKSLLLCGWQPTAGLDWGLGLLLFNPEWWYSVAIVRLSAFLEASPGFQGHKFHWLNNLTLYVWDFPWSPRVAFTRQILPLTKMSPTFISILSNIHRGNHQLLWDFFSFFTQAVLASYSQPSTSHISMPAGSDARKTSNATSSIQKAASLHKVMPSQSTAPQLVPKPPTNHRQAVIRKAAAQRTCK